MPPCTWPSTSSGLIAWPTSCAATKLQAGAQCQVPCPPRPPPDAPHSRTAHRARPGHWRRAASSADRRFPPRQNIASRIRPPAATDRARCDAARIGHAISPAQATARLHPQRCSWRRIFRPAAPAPQAAPHCPTRRSGARLRSCRHRASRPYRGRPASPAPSGTPSACAKICAITVLEPCPISDRTLMQDRACRHARHRGLIVEGLGKRGVAAAIPPCRHAHAALHRDVRGVEGCALRLRRGPRPGAAPRGRP